MIFMDNILRTNFGDDPNLGLYGFATEKICFIGFKPKNKLESKFNVKGWFKCTKDGEGIYNKISFGDPVTFDNWIEGVKSGEVFFDSGMYQGNIRPYSQWRANNSYWDNLITSSY